MGLESTRMASGGFEVSLSQTDNWASKSQLGNVLSLACSRIWGFCWAKWSVLPASTRTEHPAWEVDITDRKPTLYRKGCHAESSSWIIQWIRNIICTWQVFRFQGCNCWTRAAKPIEGLPQLRSIPRTYRLREWTFDYHCR